MFPLVSNDPIYTRSFRSIRGTIGGRKDISKRLDARSNQIVGERFSVNFFSPTSLVPFSRVRFSLSLILSLSHTLSLSLSHYYYRIVTLRDSKARSIREVAMSRSFRRRSPLETVYLGPFRIDRLSLFASLLPHHSSTTEIGSSRVRLPSSSTILSRIRRRFRGLNRRSCIGS